MSMKIVNVIQGTDEWHEFRRSHYPASEAPSVMSAAKWAPRTPVELAKLRLGIEEREVSDYQQRLFDQGHAMEAAARPLVEQFILNGEPLSPMVGVLEERHGLSKPLSASFDGLDMDGTVIFEHKKWSEALSQQIRKGELDEHYRWQLDQQLLVSGAERVVFVASDARIITEFDFEVLADEYAVVSEPFDDGTGEQKRYAAMHFEWMEYRPDPGRFERLIEGWKAYEEVERNLVHTDPSVDQAAAAYAALMASIEEHKAHISALEKMAKPYRDYLVGVAKSAGGLVTDKLEVKRVERKGALDMEKLAELLPEEKLEACRKPATVSWRVVVAKDAQAVTTDKETGSGVDKAAQAPDNANLHKTNKVSLIPGMLAAL